MAINRKNLVVCLGLIFAFYGCVPQILTPNPNLNSDTSTPIPPKVHSLAPQPKFTSTVIPTFYETSTQRPDTTSATDWWWFPIPEIAYPEVMDTSKAQTFQYIKIPPLPNEFNKEFEAAQNYGEVPIGTVFYHIFLVRIGNARMFWLGIPFIGNNKCCGQECCGQETQYRIYDSIPFPSVEKDDLLIPFVCRRNNEFDSFLIVVAETPKKGESATNIRYAWRIDQESTSLKPVSTKGIECRPDLY